MEKCRSSRNRGVKKAALYRLFINRNVVSAIGWHPTIPFMSNPSHTLTPHLAHSTIPALTAIRTGAAKIRRSRSSRWKKNKISRVSKKYQRERTEMKVVTAVDFFPVTLTIMR